MKRRKNPFLEIGKTPLRNRRNPFEK